MSVASRQGSLGTRRNVLVRQCSWLTFKLAPYLRRVLRSPEGVASRWRVYLHADVILEGRRQSKVRCIVVGGVDEMVLAPWREALPRSESVRGSCRDSTTLHLETKTASSNRDVYLDIQAIVTTCGKCVTMKVGWGLSANNQPQLRGLHDSIDRRRQ